MRGFHDKKHHAYKFKIMNTREKVFGTFDRVKSVFNTTGDWSIDVKMNKISDKNERRRLKKELEKARMKSTKEIYEGFYDRPNQVFYVYKVYYPHASVKPENVNYNVYSIEMVNEKGVVDVIEGDYEEDKHILRVNDDFEVKVILNQDVPEKIKKMKHNAVLRGPVENVKEEYEGIYEEESPKSIKFYVLKSRKEKQSKGKHGKENHKVKEHGGHKQQHVAQAHKGHKEVSRKEHKKPHKEVKKEHKETHKKKHKEEHKKHESEEKDWDASTEDSEGSSKDSSDSDSE